MQERANIERLNQTIDELSAEAEAAKGTMAHATRALDESVATSARYLDQATRATATLEEATDGLREWMVSFGGTADLILETERGVLDRQDDFHRRSMEANDELRAALSASEGRAEEGRQALCARVAQDVEAASRSVRADVAQGRGEAALKLEGLSRRLDAVEGEARRLAEEASKAAAMTRGLRVAFWVLVILVVADLAVSAAALVL